MLHLRNYAPAVQATAGTPVPANSTALHIRFLDADDKVVVEFDIPADELSMNVRSVGVITGSDYRKVYRSEILSVAEKKTVVRIDGFQTATSFVYLDLAHLFNLLPMPQWSRDGLIPRAFQYLRVLKMSKYQWVYDLEQPQRVNEVGLGALVALYVKTASSWKTQHKQIFEFAFVLASVERMANAYVLLWIANLLPCAQYHVDLRKLRLIEAVIASRRRVVQRRLVSAKEV